LRTSSKIIIKHTAHEHYSFQIPISKLKTKVPEP
jgi:hypothetical protein